MDSDPFISNANDSSDKTNGISSDKTNEVKGSLGSSKHPSHALLLLISQGETRKTICQLLKISNSALSQRFSTLERNGLITPIQRRPVSIYKLTEKGEQVKGLIGQSDEAAQKNLEGMWKCHHVIMGCRVEEWGSWQFNQQLWKTMKGGWHWQKLHIDGHNIRIQEPTKTKKGLIAIHCPPIYSREPDQAFIKMENEAQKIGTFIAEKYGMTLSSMMRIREGHKELVGSEKIAQHLGYIKVGKVWVDASGIGGKKLEESQDTNKIEKLLDLPNRMETIESKLVPAIESLTQQSNWLAENIKSHRQVLTDIGLAIKELRNAVKEMKK